MSTPTVEAIERDAAMSALVEAAKAVTSWRTVGDAEYGGTFATDLAALRTALAGVWPRAVGRTEDREEDGEWSVLYAMDAEGEVELDAWPYNGGAGDAAVEAEALNADPAELRQCIVWARTKTGPWSPRPKREEAGI